MTKHMTYEEVIKKLKEGEYKGVDMYLRQIKMIKDVHDETNYDKFKVSLQNKLNGLKFQYSDFNEHISRLASGAGKYIVKGIKEGLEKTIGSFTEPFKRKINVNETNNEELEKEFQEIEELNTLKKNDS